MPHGPAVRPVEAVARRPPPIALRRPGRARAHHHGGLRIQPAAVEGAKPSLPSAPKRKAKPHPGAHRLLHPDPTRPHDVLAPACRACGADLSGAERSPGEVYDRVEIPTIEPDATRASLHGGPCPCCARRFKAEPSMGLEPGTPCRADIRASVIDPRAVQGIPLGRLRDALPDLPRRDPDIGLTIGEDAPFGDPRDHRCL